jgi:hypothetical protein
MIVANWVSSFFSVHLLKAKILQSMPRQEHADAEGQSWRDHT